MANDSVTVTFARLVEYIAKKFLRGEVTLGELFGLSDKEIDVIFLMGSTRRPWSPTTWH